MFKLRTIFPILLIAATAASAKAQVTFDAGQTGSHLEISTTPPGLPFDIILIPTAGQQEPAQRWVSCLPQLFYPDPSITPPTPAIIMTPPPMYRISSGPFQIHNLHSRYWLGVRKEVNCPAPAGPHTFIWSNLIGVHDVQGISSTWTYDSGTPGGSIVITIVDGSSGGGLTASGSPPCQPNSDSKKN